MLWETTNNSDTKNKLQFYHLKENEKIFLN